MIITYDRLYAPDTPGRFSPVEFCRSQKIHKKRFRSIYCTYEIAIMQEGLVSALQIYDRPIYISYVRWGS